MWEIAFSLQIKVDKNSSDQITQICLAQKELGTVRKILTKFKVWTVGHV